MASSYEKGNRGSGEAVAGGPGPAAVDEEAERAMYEHTIDRLGRAGHPFRSTRSRILREPGHECRHNLVYWANDAYFGVGAWAALRVTAGASASSNTPRTGGAVPPTGSRQGEPATGPTETARSPRGRAARETAVLMLRRTGTGIDRADFAASAPASISTPWSAPRSPGTSGTACSRTTASACGSRARACSSPIPCPLRLCFIERVMFGWHARVFVRVRLRPSPTSQGESSSPWIIASHLQKLRPGAPLTRCPGDSEDSSPGQGWLGRSLALSNRAQRLRWSRNEAGGRCAPLNNLTSSAV